MKKKIKFIISIFLIVTILFSTVEVHAIWGVIGSNALKVVTRSLGKSILRKAGVKAVQKTALRRAEERWFARFTKDQLLAIEKAAKVAEPVVGKKGWLKTAVGVTMFLTGVDIAVDLYDLFSTNNDVVSYTDKADQSERVLGKFGIYVERELYNDDVLSESYVFLKSHLDKDWWHAVGADFPNTLNGAKTMRSTEFPHLDFYVDTDHIKVTTYWLTDSFVNRRDDNMILNKNDHCTTRLVRAKTPCDLNNKLIKVDSRNFPFEYERLATPTLVPNPHPDIFPNDQQAVEIVFPDPNHVPDVEQEILDNSDTIINPNLDNVPNPNLDKSDDPNNDDNNNDDKNWSEKLKRLVTTKFPFSLPWDLYHLFSLLNADPITPFVRVDENFNGMPFKFHITFTYLDQYMPFFRGFIIISFCLMLVMSTRKLLGGST